MISDKNHTNTRTTKILERSLREILRAPTYTAGYSHVKKIRNSPRLEIVHRYIPSISEGFISF